MMNLDALRNIGYGMYVIGAGSGSKLNAQIANTVFQISSQPPTVAVSINKNNLTHEYIRASKAFSASILSEDTELSFIGHFGFKSGRDMDKLAGINYKIGETGVPVIFDNATAYLEAKVIKEVDAGTHTIFIGEVVAADVLTDKPSMTYSYYQRVKRGTTPKTAPSFIEKKKVEVEKLPKYRCNICSYIYDPELGDPDSGIKPGTPFEKLPDDWVCPVCGADKSEFEKVD
jgi:flavin reductase (DIM6/NTAB) family NADH-FMN oxidoreductase RutF/rubredoxin